MNRLQAAKDSLYVALRDGMEQVNPGRIAEIGGTVRIAVAMAGALGSAEDAEIPGVFYLGFKGMSALTAGSTVVKMGCEVKYRAKTDAELSAMDGELLQASLVGQAELVDWSSGAAVDLGDRVFWTMPVWKGAGAAEMELVVRG